MENWFFKFADLIGASVCHQIAERSFSAGSFTLPVCARCEGIYVGFFISAIFLFAMFRKKESELPRAYIIVILGIFIFSTVADGGLSYLSIIDTNNISRFITGFLAGSASMAIIYPVFNYQYYADSIAARIFPRFWQFAVFLVIDAVVIALGLIGFSELNLVFFYISFISVIFTFYFINLVILFLIPFFAKKATLLFSRQLVLPSVIAVLLSGIELYLSYILHQFIAGLQF